MRILLSLFAALAATGAAAQSHQYVVRPYPTGAPACHAEARELGRRLGAEHGVAVREAACLASVGGGVEVRVTYDAPEPLRLVSTEASGSSVAAEPGWFSTEAECRAALPGEVAHFRLATGLEPFLALCYASPLARDYPWVPRIDGFGDSGRALYYAGTLLFGSPLGFTRATFTETVREAALAQGVDVRRVTLASGGGYSKVTVVHYAGARQRLEMAELAKVDTTAQCNAELARLRALYRDATAQPLVTFCASQLVGGVETQALFLGATGFRFSLSVESYGSYAACDAARPGLVRFYQEELGRPVAGGLCTRRDETADSRLWGVRLFETE